MNVILLQAVIDFFTQPCYKRPTYKLIASAMTINDEKKSFKLSILNSCMYILVVVRETGMGVAVSLTFYVKINVIVRGKLMD